MPDPHYLDYNGLTTYTGYLNTELAAKADSSDLNSYLLLAGGSMTGQIKRESTTLDLTAADNGLSSYWNPALCKIEDKNDNAMGYIQWYAHNTGYTYVQIDARNMGTGSNVTNYLQLRVNNDGTRVVNVPEAAPWRTALGVPALSENNKYQNCTQYIKFTGVDSSKSDNDISSSISRGWEMLDKNDKYISYLETTAGTDGSIQLSLVARNLGTGSNINNGLYIKVANNGTRSISVSEAAPWRSGLGVCGVKTVSKTTGSFTSYHTTTTITAPASGWTCIGFVRCCSNGDVDTPYVDSWSQSGTTVTASIWRATTVSITVTLTALFVNQSL